MFVAHRPLSPNQTRRLLLLTIQLLQVLVDKYYFLLADALPKSHHFHLAVKNVRPHISLDDKIQHDDYKYHTGLPILCPYQVANSLDKIQSPIILLILLTNQVDHDHLGLVY